MPKVTYDPGPDGPSETTMRGQRFEAGKAVNVDWDDAAMTKLKNNPHFNVAGNQKNEKAQAKAAADAEAAAADEAPPKDAAHPPMWPEAHHKETVMPTGVLTDTEPEDEDAPQPRRGPGRPPKR